MVQLNATVEHTVTDLDTWDTVIMKFSFKQSFSFVPLYIAQDNVNRKVG